MRVKINNHSFEKFIGLTGVISKEDNLQYIIRLDNNQDYSGTVTAPKQSVDFIDDEQCCIYCGKATTRDDGFCSNSCKKFYLIG